MAIRSSWQAVGLRKLHAPWYYGVSPQPREANDMSVSLVKHPKPQGTMWVCADCLHAAVNGEVSDDRPADLPEPWALEMDTDVTPGITADEHRCMGSADDCDDCECTTRTFSDSSCDGCGDWHAGDRHAFTYWG